MEGVAGMLPARRCLCLVGLLLAAGVAWWMQLRTAWGLPYAVAGVIVVPVLLWFLFPAGDGDG